jgi:trimeric autotransporter adhesin
MVKRLLWIEAFVCCMAASSALSQTVQPWFDSPLDGQVNSIAVSGNKAYLGGTFTKIGYACGTGAFLDTATAKPDRTFPKLDPVQGRVYASIPDGRGGWYVGGNFSYVGGLQRKYLVHVRSDHSVDSWNPSPNSFVQCLSLAGNRLYVGGNFTTIAGQTRGYGAVFDTATGSLLSWNPQADNEITAVQQVGGTVFLGGYFSSVGGQFRPIMGSVDTATGNATNWFPLNGGPSQIASVSQFIYANGYIYACGPFTQINSVARLGLVKMDAAGNVVLGWNPGSTLSGGFGIVSSMALSHGKLYVGGSFTAIGGQTVTDVAAIDTGSGQASTWNPAANNTVRTVAIAGSRLFVGGDFTSIGGKNVSYLASVDTSTGTASTWDAQLNENPYTLSSYGNILFAGGLFTSAGSVTRNNLAAVDLTTGLITPWNPNASGGVSALALVADKVIVGGNFTSIGGTNRSYLAAVDTAGGSLIPAWNATTGGSVFAMMVFGNRLYLGGNFGNVNGSVRSYLAAVDKNSGAVLPWHPALDNGGVYSFANSGSLVFTSGFFSKINGQTRNYAAAFDTTTDSLTAWNPNPSYLCWSLATQGPTVYLGGGFTTVGGVSRKSIAAVDTSTGALLAGFDAKFDLNLNVNVILPSGNQLIIGGGFETINTLTREQLAYLDAGTGAVSSWSSNINNNIGSGTIYSIAQAPHTLLVGGEIIGILDFPEQNFAVMTDSSIVLKPGLSASHKTIDFGKVPLGSFKDTTVTIANNGAAGLNITSIVSSGNPFFSRVVSTGLSPGQSFIDTLRFTPAAAGLANASIIITSNASSSPDTIQVSGSGVLGVPRSVEIHHDRDTINVGIVYVDHFKDTSFVVSNIGNDTLHVDSTSVTNPKFSVRHTSFVVPQSGAYTDTVRFTPLAVGTFSGFLILSSDATNMPSDTIVVIGTCEKLTSVPEQVVPRAFSLSQNYPNPFNPSTIINYQLPKGNHVTLRLYDAIGREVARLVDGYKEAGSYDIQFNASKLSSGVYFYRIQAGNYVDMKKMMLMK